MNDLGISEGGILLDPDGPKGKGTFVAVRLLQFIAATVVAFVVVVAHIFAMKRVSFYPRGQFSAIYVPGLLSLTILYLFVLWTWIRDRSWKLLILLVILAYLASGFAASCAMSAAWRTIGGGSL